MPQYVGITEIKRQWVESHADATHHRPKGDGHDNMWAKLIEFVLWCVISVVGAIDIMWPMNSALDCTYAL